MSHLRRTNCVVHVKTASKWKEQTREMIVRAEELGEVTLDEREDSSPEPHRRGNSTVERKGPGGATSREGRGSMVANTEKRKGSPSESRRWDNYAAELKGSRGGTGKCEGFSSEFH